MRTHSITFIETEQLKDYYIYLLREDTPEFIKNTESEYHEITTNIEIITKKENTKSAGPGGTYRTGEISRKIGKHHRKYCYKHHHKANKVGYLCRA